MSATTHREDPAHPDTPDSIHTAPEADRPDTTSAVDTGAAAPRRKSRSKRDVAEPVVTEPAKITKTTALITLLAAEGGAGVATLSAALGWLPHTTRAALTRLRQAGYGLEAIAPPEGGARRYRITSTPQPPASA